MRMYRLFAPADTDKCARPRSARKANYWQLAYRHGDAHIRMEQVNGKVQGKLSWVREPNHPDGKPKLDDKNPDKDKRNRPLLGLYLLKGFTYSGEGKWEGGTVYDPELGKVYNCILTLNGNDKLEVRGYIGFAAIGRTETWTRVKGN